MGQKSLFQQAKKTSAVAFEKKIISNIAEKQYTKSNLKLGQQMHKSYKLELHNPAQGFHKEFRLPSGKRIDFLDANNNIIYEMKPNNPRAIMQGHRQLKIYQQELEVMPKYQDIH